MKSLFRQTVLFILLSSAITASAQIRPVTRPVRTQESQQPTTTQKPTRTTNNKPATQKTQISAAARDKILANLVADMVYVEGGTFTMGATAEQGSVIYKDEKPAHKVTLSSFYICKHEVTQEEWEAVMGSNPSNFKRQTCVEDGVVVLVMLSNPSNFKGKRLPVERVSWEDCQTFISKLNSITGKQYRLPTEAEWEYAARGGNRSKGYKYSGSNTLGDVAWYDGNSGNKTHKVMTKSPNELGLYDMSGNVVEWCSDWFDREYYADSPNNNPKGPSSGSYRVERGGSWGYDTESCRVSFRGGSTPSHRISNRGLRLAL